MGKPMRGLRSSVVLLVGMPWRKDGTMSVLAEFQASAFSPNSDDGPTDVTAFQNGSEMAEIDRVERR